MCIIIVAGSESWNELRWYMVRQCPSGRASNSGGQYKSDPAGSCYGGGASANQGSGFTSMPSVSVTSYRSYMAVSQQTDAE